MFTVTFPLVSKAPQMWLKNKYMRSRRDGNWIKYRLFLCFRPLKIDWRTQQYPSVATVSCEMLDEVKLVAPCLLPLLLLCEQLGSSPVPPYFYLFIYLLSWSFCCHKKCKSGEKRLLAITKWNVVWRKLFMWAFFFFFFKCSQSWMRKYGWLGRVFSLINPAGTGVQVRLGMTFS